MQTDSNKYTKDTYDICRETHAKIQADRETNKWTYQAPLQDMFSLHIFNGNLAMTKENHKKLNNIFEWFIKCIL